MFHTVGFAFWNNEGNQMISNSYSFHFQNSRGTTNLNIFKFCKFQRNQNYISTYLWGFIPLELPHFISLLRDLCIQRSDIPCDRLGRRLLLLRRLLCWLALLALSFLNKWKTKEKFENYIKQEMFVSYGTRGDKMWWTGQTLYAISQSDGIKSF